jgi:polygalacturonase
MRINTSKNVEVNGIFIRSTRGWTCTVTDCYKTVFENVKVFSFLQVYSLDGINPVSCKNAVINNCFIRTRDDCIAIKSFRAENITTDSISVTKSLLVGWYPADGVTLGFELQGGEVKNVFVRDCDIVRARGGGRTGGHSAFSIVCDGPSKVSNICFENIHVASDIEYKNLEIIITDGTLYGKGGIGSINGVYMKDVYWENARKSFVIQGYDSSHLIENVVFWNCYAGGKLMTKPEDAEFQMEYVKNITFIPGGTYNSKIQ